MPDVFGVLWVLSAALAMLLPALVHGLHLGPYDLLTKQGLSVQGGVTVHNYVNGDQVDALLPWTNLAWTQIHHGQLPLWNPYNGLGMPLAFNWQSAPFSIPSLIGYLFPLQYAYTVGIVVMMMIAGTGAYLLGRVLRLGAIASALVGTVFELSGPLAGWIGYPLTSVMAWTGWLFAIALMVVAGRHRVRDISLFAVLLACAVYAGQPEALVVLMLSLGIFLVVMLPLRARATRRNRGVLRPVTDLLIGAAAGGALAAPLALPGLQLVSLSVRHGAPGVAALPSHDLTYLIFQGFDGLPIFGSYPFGNSFFYNETVAYVGITTVVLAVVALGLRWRRPEVVALAVMTASMVAIAFVPPLASFMDRLPGVGNVSWLRALMPMAFGSAALAGVGLDAVVRGASNRAVRRWLGGTFTVAGSVLIFMWFFGRGHLVPVLVTIRDRSFLWPTINVAVGLAVVASLFVAGRRTDRGREHPGTRMTGGSDQADALGVGSLGIEPSRDGNPGTESIAPGDALPRVRRFGLGRLAGLALLTCETVFLVTAGAPLVSSSPQGLTDLPAEATFQRAVGTSIVGFGGSGPCAKLGIVPNVNDAYGVHELGLYDPTTPRAYYQAWVAMNGQSAGIPGFNEFCPAVTTVSSARRWGVSFVLEPHGQPGPAGAVFDQRVGDEDLYRIPGAGEATLTPARLTGPYPAPDAAGTPVAVVNPTPAKWKIATNAATPQVLRLRLTDVPGWQATIDGKPLELDQFSGIMLQAHIPSGRHTIKLSYWPKTFTLGLIVAACTAVGLAAAVIVDGIRRRHRGITTSEE